MPLGARGGAGAIVLLALGLGGVHSGCAQSAGEQVAEQRAPIIGGELDTTHRGVVSLLKAVEGGYFPSCTGTLLAPNLVLTAHHCVADLINSSDGQSVECDTTTFAAPQPAQTMIVSVEANVGREGLDPYQVAEVVLPPQAGNQVCGKDIAMLRLAGNIPGNIAQPIAPRLANEVVNNEQFAAIGYGLQDPNDRYGETVGHRMGVSDAQVFCAGVSCGADFVARGEWVGESPVCSGDSGGPALDRDGRVAGITSRGDAACTLGIYTSVYAWADFIRATAFEAAARGGYAPPTWAGDPPTDFPMGGTGGMPGASGSSASGGSGGASPTIAGSGSVVVGGTGSGPTSPTLDALGLACANRCPGNYYCWSASGDPPGACVPRCGAGLAECPESYTCSAEVDACVPSHSADSGSNQPKQSSSCTIAAPRSASGGAFWLAAAALGVLAGRRRLRR